jgi:hypothetical protein
MLNDCLSQGAFRSGPVRQKSAQPAARLRLTPARGQNRRPLFRFVTVGRLTNFEQALTNVRG